MTDMGEGKGKNRCHVAQRYVRVTKKLTLTSAMVSIAKVLAWFKQEGDIVKRNDVLCDIETKVGVGCLCHTKKVLLRHMDETHVLFFLLLCILLHRSQGGNGNKVKPNAGDENDNDDTDDKPVHEKLKRRTLVVVEIINVWYLTYIYFLGGNLRMHHIHSQFNNSVHS
jgi:hypothetical protein